MPLFSRRAAPSSDVPVLPYDSRSAEGLAARWVRWVASAGPLKNPLDDATGEHAAVNQPDDVWFLAGSYGKRVLRRCFVPAGRELFLPAFNMWEYPSTGPAPVVEDAWGSLTVDGRQWELATIGTPEPFVVAGARLNGVTSRKTPTPTTVWGLWALIGPLSPGPHEVHAAGGDGHGFEVDVTYQITVGGADPGYRTP
ncbi:hypothetical protein [Blastococcus xanthinilyticus]|uniref:Uncharacterized protein n=1 Tax=Blastococcus xanthinilyticus TaxID=1564164 RepID=A0A5S5CV40_9ACTN|nr:hypothetical protein [Blastococcus xanthinilyticus]TYP87475.1 hypothetical protein BD833_10663 [Blastococcus xanthinilyticus]